MMSRIHLARCRVLALVLVLCIIPAAYVCLIAGAADTLWIARDRRSALGSVETASESTPPDVNALLRALEGNDWLVAAVAAERIGQLQESDKLNEEQADHAARSLLDALASGGHWWRFGWDRDEPEFNQFRSAAIEAVSTLGPAALTDVASAMGNSSPFQRESACWIVVSGLANGSIDPPSLAGHPDILRQIDALAQTDPDESVKSACTSAQKAIQNP